MEARGRWSRALVILGSIAFCIGTLDPMEGSLLILAGCGLVLIGTYLGGQARPMLLYWGWVTGLVAVGVGALWGLSALGGVGGTTGRSMWWLLACLPYPAGWLLALGGLVVRAGRALKITGRGVPPLAKGA
jgi:hypothetical protein